MLGIDSKREIITGEFARKIWSEVLAMWHREKEADLEEPAPEFKVECFYDKKTIYELLRWVK